MGQKRARGRPPKPNALSPAERMRRYRARRKAAETPSEATGTIDAGYLADLRERLRQAVLQVEILTEDRARLDRRNAELEAELRRVEQAHNATLKELVGLRQALDR